VANSFRCKPIGYRTLNVGNGLDIRTKNSRHISENTMAINTRLVFKKYFKFKFYLMLIVV